MRERQRAWPDRDLDVAASVIGFLRFVATTAGNKLAGLTEEQARRAPIATSPVMSPLGLIEHLTAVQRQHIQIHIGGLDLPSLWRADDHDYEFRLTPDDTIEHVVAAFDEECARSFATLADTDLDREVVVHDERTRAGRLLVDVVQECARHLGHLDIVRELIDGAVGE